MNISVDKLETRQIANSIIENAESIADEIKVVLATIEKLESYWQGPDATKHIDVLRNNCVSELNKFQSVMASYGQYLKNVSAGYNTLDGIYSAKKID